MFKKLIDNSAAKSPWLFHINAGSCNGCDIELVAVLTIEQVPDPKVIVTLGSCPRSCNVFKGSYSVVGPLDKYVDIDVSIAGCAPKPEAIIDGLALATQILKEKRGAKE